LTKQTRKKGRGVWGSTARSRDSLWCPPAKKGKNPTEKKKDPRTSLVTSPFIEREREREKKEKTSAEVFKKGDEISSTNTTKAQIGRGGKRKGKENFTNVIIPSQSPRKKGEGRAIDSRAGRYLSIALKAGNTQREEKLAVITSTTSSISKERDWGKKGGRCAWKKKKRRKKKKEEKKDK